MNRIRVFFGHPAGLSSDGIDAASKELRGLLRARAEKTGRSLKISVVPGRDDHKLNFTGDWDAWAKAVISRKDSITLQRHYDIIVVPSETVGRATAQIVEAALTVGRPVILFDEGTLKKVVGIHQHDPEDWQGGFTLDLWEPPQESTQLKLPLEVPNVRNS
tara:strand:- start:120 stop:602 length:483 start_codon:yes stop_codon:yes gene_type:complete